MREWKECKLGDIADVQTGPFGSQLHMSDYKSSGTPIITVEHLGDNRIIHSNLPLVGEEDRNRLIKYTLKTGDVVFSRVGSVDRCAYIHESENSWLFSGRLLRVRSNEFKVDPRFLSFYFSQESFKETIRMIAVGATMPSINTEILSNVELLIPPLPEQRAIAGVLSSLDDKIDLLNRQKKTLEGMAESIWRKMFVEEADTRWGKGKLGDYGEFKNGINYSRNENGDSEYSILNVRDIVESKYLNASKFEKIWVNYDKATPYLLKRGDIVIVRSASPGESLIVLDDFENLIYSGFSIRLRCHDRVNSLFLFLFLQSYKKEMDMFSDGTTLKNINQEILNSIELTIPDNDKIKTFNERLLNIYNKILLNQTQIKSLSNLRVTLLPKLMSGGVRVKY